MQLEFCLNHIAFKSLFKHKTMTTSSGQLTANQIERLARAIDSRNMEPIALAYLNIKPARLKNLRYENKDDAEAFNREVIHDWICGNPGINHVEVSIGTFLQIIIRAVKFFTALLLIQTVQFIRNGNADT